MTNESSVKSMPRASTILGALEGVRNIRAGIVTALVLIANAVVFVSFSYLTTRFGNFALAAVGGLLVVLIAAYGASAVGFMLMNDAKGAPPLAIVEALTLSLSSTHRWICVMLLAALVFALFALALVLVLFICKIPFLGPVLYAGVLPLATIATAAFLAAMYFVVMPLAFPAVWLGDTTMQVMSKLLAIIRQRLVQVVAHVLLLLLLCFIAGGIIGGLMFAGLAVVGMLSAALLPNVGGAMGGLGGMMAGVGREGGGYLIAGGIGGAIIFAVVTIVPFLILIRGYCSIYLDVIQGIDFSAAESQLKSGMENIQRKAREAQERAREKMQSPPVTPAAPVSGTQREPPAAPLATAPAAAAAAATAATQITAAGQCPKCGAAVTAEDKFCGGCGAKLN
jgi:hypothetical protein